MVQYKMIRFVNKTPDEIIAIVGAFRRGRKIVLSNFFSVGDGEYGLYEAEDSLLIRKKDLNFYRTYIISSNIEESESILTELNSEAYVINIPSKGSIDNWKMILQRAGYDLIGVYKRYYNNKIKVRKSAMGEYAVLSDINGIESLLINNFSPYTDYLPSLVQLRGMVDNKQVLVSKDDSGEVLGTLIYSLEGTKCYYNIWIDKSGKGLFLLYKAYNIVAENNIGYVYFWVNSMNHDVIRLHEMMGAVPDGLVDYTFIKKNISTMKEQIINILTELRPEFDFTGSVNFIEDGMLDSFDIVALVSELDSRFDISIDGMDILPENFASVEAIEKLLMKNGAQ